MWFWFRLFGREWYIEQWCKWSEVPPWEVVREDYDDRWDTKLIWIGPFHISHNRIEPLWDHVEVE